MYHSTATVVPDGSILIGTSDSNNASRSYGNMVPNILLQRDQTPTPISWLTPRSHLSTGMGVARNTIASLRSETVCRMEFLSPPYMFQDRPTFKGLPALVDYGKTFTLDINLPTSATGATGLRVFPCSLMYWCSFVLAVALMDFGFATHTVHMDQKYVELRSSLSRDKKSIRITAPANPRLFSPGPGFIFIITDKGVPSVAKRLIIGKGASPPVDQGAIDK